MRNSRKMKWVLPWLLVILLVLIPGGCIMLEPEPEGSLPSSEAEPADLIIIDDSTERESESAPSEAEPEPVSESASEEPESETETPEETETETEPPETQDESPAIRPTETNAPKGASEKAEKEYRFRSKKLKTQHYEKHGIEMGFKSADEYEAAASKVPNHPDVLHKTEKEDGDDVYYLEETNEFVVISKDGYIRTYFLPSAGKKYYDRQ